MNQPSVALLGASGDRAKFGNKSVRAHAAAGWRVFPINPKGGEIEGLKVCRSLAEAPVERFDRVSVYLPPSLTLGALAEIAAKGCDELWLNPGSDDDAVVAKAEELGLNVVRGCSIVDVGKSPHD
jgi:predicted CoA-binding protein